MTNAMPPAWKAGQRLTATAKEPLYRYLLPLSGVIVAIGCVVRPAVETHGVGWLTQLGSYSTEVFSLLYLVAAYLVVARWSQSWQIIRRSAGLISIPAFVLLSAAWSAAPLKVVMNFGHQMGLMLIAIAAVIAARDSWTSAVWAVFFGSLVVLIGSIALVMLVPSAGLDPVIYNRWRGMTTHPNSLGTFALIGAWAAITTRYFATTLRARFWRGVMYAVVATCLWGSNSMTSTILTLVAAFAAPVTSWTLRSGPAVAVVRSVTTGLILLIGTTAAYIAFPEAFSPEVALPAIGRSDTYTGRTALWAAAGKAFQERPLLGWSFDSHATVLEFLRMEFTQFHNGYLDVAVRGGSIGIILLSIVVLSLASRLLRLHRAHRYLAISLAVFLALCLAHNLMEASFIYRNVLWLLFVFAYVISGHLLGEQDWQIRRHAQSLARERVAGGAEASHRVLACLTLLTLSVQPATAWARRNWDQLGAFPAAPENVSVFATPVAYADGAIFTVNVEPSDDDDGSGYRWTVVRKGIRDAEGSWRWERAVIERRTIPDSYHTQASIAVDADGYLHVAYNMHNAPWQYLHSKRPGDISEFEFRGDLLSDRDIETIWKLNKTPFPSAGSADIPGNQITYPAFFQDRHGTLYVTYRFALRPKRRWEERELAAAIARYDLSTRTWNAIGGPVSRTMQDVDTGSANLALPAVAFAAQSGWTPYLPRLHFDAQDRMHVTWTWRIGLPGAEVVLPTYAFSADGGKTFQRVDRSDYALPIRADASGIVGAFTSHDRFYALTSVTTRPDGDPVVVLNPSTGGRVLIRFDAIRQQWSAPSPSPFAASNVITDDVGNEWAVATGVRLFRRAKGTSDWREIISDQGLCDPKPHFIRAEQRLLVHARKCDEPVVVILSAVID